MSEVKEYLSWVTTMLSASKEKRQKWVESIFEGLKSYRNKKAPNLVQEVKYLSDILQDDSTWEVIGFSVNLQYVRAECEDEEMLKYVYVHPWGTPPLLLKHKKLPMFVVVGPGVRWNDTILREIHDNQYTDHVVGATG